MALSNNKKGKTAAMAEEPKEPGIPTAGEVKVSEAVGLSGYSHSYITSLIRNGLVKGHKAKTEIGSYWLVDLEDLLRYTNQPHKTGPKGHTFDRNKNAPEGEGSKTKAAA